MATERLEIMTAERQVYSEDVDVVVAPGVSGQLGILPHHAPLLTMLEPGELMVRRGGEEEFVAITGGFLEVMANRIVILADAVERAEEIDEERAMEAMRRAQERLEGHPADLDLQRALASIRRAQARLKVARRRRRRYRGGPPSSDTGA
jgi:F-type H+-transporting ATPase subunit epsilon